MNYALKTDNDTVYDSTYLTSGEENAVEVFEGEYSISMWIDRGAGSFRFTIGASCEN
ncbi:hypothetical protein GCM10007904_39970 [Oharaeibacter diazotrophicus]|nr:hypothetical protein GCM10007904_39970 [Oharaeibacter diazotrophicus]